MPLLRTIAGWIRRSTTDERSAFSRPTEPWTPGYAAGGSPAAADTMPWVALSLMVLAIPLLVAALLPAAAYETIVRLDGRRRLDSRVHWGLAVAVSIAVVLGAVAVLTR
jgi:hypothetical protein